MFAKDREAMRLTPAEVRLILIESLQWCANNAVYFLGLIGAATYDLAGTAFLVAAITLVRNLMTSVGNMVSGSVIDRFGPRRTSFVTCVITAVLSLGVGLAPLSVPGLVFAACVLGLAGGFINTCTHAFPGYLESTTEGRTRVNGLMVFYSNIAYTAGPLLGGAIVSCFATQSVYLLMAGMMGVAAVLSLGCHECVAPAKGEKPKGGILGGMSDSSEIIFRAAIKPTPSISRTQHTVTREGEPIDIQIKGRHDPIIVPRAVVVVQSMAALVLIDALMQNMTARVDYLRDFYKN